MTLRGLVHWQWLLSLNSQARKRKGGTGGMGIELVDVTEALSGLPLLVEACGLASSRRRHRHESRAAVDHLLELPLRLNVRYRRPPP